jgi:citrate lyase subunit beta/citryl-CoA lyase
MERGRALRTLLFCPGDSEKKIARALECGADAVILDLEDSVAAGAKVAARQLVKATLSAPRSRAVLVRVNAADTSFYLDDIAAIASGRPEAIMLPKCAGPDDLRRLSAQLDALEAAFGIARGAIGILPLVTETAGSLHAMNYASVTPRLLALGFAGEDLASDLGVAGRIGGALNPLLAEARRAVALAAVIAEVPAIDTPYPDPRDPEGLVREAKEAAALGFAGKLCIHPGQVDAVNAAFRPAPAEVAWGRAVIAALEGHSAGVATVDGRMVDKAHLRLARRYVAAGEAGAVGA